MNKFFASILAPLLVTPVVASAYIIPTRMILQRTSDNAGAATYAIEQDVQFSNGDDTIQLKESWLIDSEQNMRLTVTGTKDLQNTFKMQFVYAGGLRWKLIGNATKNEKISEDFLERFFNYRNADTFANALAHQKIIPNGAYSKRASGKTGNDFKHEPEEWVRYSRSGGVVNYALGAPSPADLPANNPGIWIEQDQFVIRKLRLLSQAEIVADNYNQFAKGLVYPKTRTVRWGNNTVNIQLTSVTVKPKTSSNLLQPSSLNISPKTDGIDKLAAKDIILEFYSRFR
jgi:hypothetical protein